MSRFVDYFDYLEEEIRLKRLQRLVDQASFQLTHGLLSKEEAREAIVGIRAEAQRLFPDQMETYEIIYQHRFDRMLQENYPAIK